MTNEKKTIDIKTPEKEAAKTGASSFEEKAFSSSNGKAGKSEPAEATAKAPENGSASQAGQEKAAEPEKAAIKPEEEIAKLREQNADLQDKFQRAMAEQENMRRRMEREKEENAKYAVSNFARDVLTIADNIQRAIEAVPKDAAASDAALKTFLEGVEVTERELLKVMERHGIKRISPEGEKFDPNFHQAMFEMPSAGIPAGMIVQVIQPGYIIGERLLRPAMVGVSKGGAGAGPRGGAGGSGSEIAKNASAGANEPDRGGVAHEAARERTSSAAAGAQPSPSPSAEQSPANTGKHRPSLLKEPVIGNAEDGEKNSG